MQKLSKFPNENGLKIESINESRIQSNSKNIKVSKIVCKTPKASQNLTKSINFTSEKKNKNLLNQKLDDENSLKSEIILLSYLPKDQKAKDIQFSMNSRSNLDDSSRGAGSSGASRNSFRINYYYSLLDDRDLKRATVQSIAWKKFYKVKTLDLNNNIQSKVTHLKITIIYFLDAIF